MNKYLYCQNNKNKWANWNRTEIPEASPYTGGILYNTSDVGFIGNDKFLAHENQLHREKNCIRGRTLTELNIYMSRKNYKGNGKKWRSTFLWLKR